MKVPMLNPSLQNFSIRRDLAKAFSKVMDSGKYILGQEVIEFEQNCADYLGVRHAIGVSSGTDALLLSLMALRVGSGDEVICPSFTFFATAGSIARTGATPVFVDILPKCFTCDPDCIRKAITSKTKAIIPVHLFGQSADLSPILKIGEEYGISIIEDVAQAMGAEYKGQSAGSFGDFGCFSFFPSKNLGGFGDGGLVTTQDSSLAEKIVSLRNHGNTGVYYHELIGGNFRIDTLQASLLKIKLPLLNESIQRRRANASLYLDRLGNSRLYDLPLFSRGKHTYNQFTLRVKKNLRDSLISFLKEKEIGCAVYYPLPLHLQPCFDYLPSSGKSFLETERASKECISVPVANEVNVDKIEYVLLSLEEFEEQFGDKSNEC